MRFIGINRVSADNLFQLQVNPALLGGMIVNVGDKYVDMSLASKIKKYTEVLKTAV
jgi:F-type H+-transporting ATPase subunit O